MKLNHYAYIYLGPGLDPTKDNAEIKAKNYKLSVVGIDFEQKKKVIDTAKQLAAEGVQMIELCGGFGAIWMARVSEALNPDPENPIIPVGGVMYGPEARKPILSLLGKI